jgi:hypothetical protein
MREKCVFSSRALADECVAARDAALRHNAEAIAEADACRLQAEQTLAINQQLSQKNVQLATDTEHLQREVGFE